MAASLKIKHKLLLVWFGSILFSLALFAVIMVQQVSGLHEENSRQKISEAFADLRVHVSDLTKKLTHTATLLANREDVLASISMIDAYQDITNYSPLIFDVEKQALGRKLARQARTAGLTAASVYDGKRQLAAFYILPDDGAGGLGHVSFSNGKAIHLLGTLAGGTPREIPSPPLLLTEVTPEAIPVTSRTTIRPTTQGIALAVEAPIIRHLPDGTDRTVGIIVVTAVLDDSFAKEVAERTRMEFAFSMTGGARYGALSGITQLPDSKTLPDLEAKAPPSLLPSEDRFLGGARFSADSGSQVVFVFGQEKEQLLDELAKLRTASLATLLVASLILVPAGGFLLNRTISRRVEDLAHGVEAFERGVYRKMGEAAPGDELGVLAQSFDAMMAGIRDRETELRRSQARLANAQRIAHLGNWNQDLQTGEFWWSDETFRIFGLLPHEQPPSRELVTEKLCPRDRETYNYLLEDAARVGGPYAIDLRIELPDGNQRIIHFQGEVELNTEGRPGRLSGTVQDVTDQKLAEENLRSTIELLTQSNTQLERFAFLASHDLQEPLRNVISYAQLLERRYKGELGAEADEFISYVVSGAKRMRSLIHDLLAFSRISAKGQAFGAVDLADSLRVAMENLEESIEASGARIETGALPTVEGDDVQLSEVFQNLIGNAIKFVRPGEVPEVTVDAARSDAEWVISVQDRGIGMEPQYLERIFTIFKRLHTEETYPGTGVGLAICKQIIERHGGRIWAISEPGRGSTFFFALPTADEG